jgi:iron complex outermembrane receptor protein
MKKCSVIAWAAFFVMPSLVYAENNKRMEHILVTMPIHKKEAQTALPVTILSGDELRRQAAATIGATLAQTPGLSSASFGPAVGQPVIRGQQGPRVQVLQNGLPALDVSSNSADHAVSVEPILADSIEILRGPATLLYGGGAIGGVINVVDGRIPVKPVDGVEGALELRHSSGDDGRSSVLRLDAGDGRWVFHVDNLYRDWSDPDIPGLALNANNLDDVDESSDGYIANASGRTRRTTLGSAYHFDQGYWGLSYSELDNQYGIPAGVHHHHDESESAADESAEEGVSLAIEQRRWDIAGDLHLQNWFELLRWRLAYSDYQHKEIESSGEIGTVFTKQAWAARFELAHMPLGDLHGVVGLQLLDADYSAIGEESFVPQNSNQSVGLFWLEDYHRDNWSIEAGLRADLDSLELVELGLDDKNNNISASLSGVYDINEIWTATLALSQSRRAPNAEERYSNLVNDSSSYVVHGATGAIELGDRNLRDEKSSNADISLRADYDSLTAKVAGFYNQFDQFIYLHNTGTEIDDADVLSYQQQDARFHGVEYELEYLLNQGEEWRWTLSLFGDRIRGELASGEAVPRLPAGQDGLKLGMSNANWQGEIMFAHSLAQTKPGANELKTDGYDRLDTSISRKFSVNEVDFTLLLNGRNLMDEDIRSSSSFIRDYAPEAGRSLELALQLQFGK